ncbi:MAG: hypothetical protein ABW205_06970 [Burkholderiales bacterium]
MKRIALAMILVSASSVYADSMGRLFFTPEQRLMLDSARRQKVKIEEQSEEQAPEIVSLNGVVKRSDGQTTVWLNNRAVSDRRTPGGVTIVPQGTASDPVTFRMPQGDRAVSLRVGQNLDVTTGQVVEPYDPIAAEMKRAFAAKQAEAARGKRPDDAETAPIGAPSKAAEAKTSAGSQAAGRVSGTVSASVSSQPPRKTEPPAPKADSGEAVSKKPSS